MKIEKIIKTEIETYERQNVTYKTSDGIIWGALYSAEEHQKELNLEALENLADLETAAEDFTPYGNYFSSEDNDYKWYKAKTPEAIEAINETYDLEIPEKYVNEWICVEDNRDDVYYYALQNSIDDFSKLLEKLGYEIEIREKLKTEDVK